MRHAAIIREPGPVPIEIEERRARVGTEDECMEFVIVAQDHNGWGAVVMYLSGAEALALNPRVFEKLMADRLEAAVDAALTAHLVDHERRRGWPLVDCFHGVEEDCD